MYHELCANAPKCCAVLCCAVLCCAVLCCVVLCCAVLCQDKPYSLRAIKPSNHPHKLRAMFLLPGGRRGAGGDDNCGGELSEADLPANLQLAWGRLYLARLEASHSTVSAAVSPSFVCCGLRGGVTRMCNAHCGHPGCQRPPPFRRRFRLWLVAWQGCETHPHTDAHMSAHERT